LPYKDVIETLRAGAEKKGAALYLLELPAISTTLTGADLPTAAEFAADAERSLRDHGDGAACWVGHSFGSAAIAYALRHARQTVAAAVLVEPVALLLHKPEVSYGFLFCDDSDPILDLLQSDARISFSLRRRFWWQEAVLFGEDLRDVPSEVFLSEDDPIVPSAAIRQHLAGIDGVHVRSLGDREHGKWQYDDGEVARVAEAALAACDTVDTKRRRTFALPREPSFLACLSSQANYVM
jgi:pimeloyl-ACP methyl ester carboxylesterase